ncbi:hypothetical protein BJ741DRAFT_632718 [Chytriomyces cf. hyalinus JEL632]|nr:hypothetical protein BJ741DRAFT_632718 [Chytriomyces cf. hyalinus JEL632]
MDTLLELLQLSGRIERANVAFAFLFGSRVWGTHTDKSDYDVFVVLWKCAKVRSSHVQNCDYTIRTVEEFWQEVEQGDFLPTLSLFLPDSHVWVSERFSKQRSELKRAVRVGVFRDTVKERCARDWEKADKFASKGQWRAALKVVCHGVRMNTLAARIEVVAVVNRGGGALDDLSCVVSQQLWADAKSEYTDQEWRQMRLVLL